MELRGFKENIECVEKHLEFVYENIHEILEKLDTLSPENIELIQKVRGYILQYYREIQHLKLLINYLEDITKENAQKEIVDEAISIIISKLSKIRKNLRTVRKIIHVIKNNTIDKEYEKLKEQAKGDVKALWEMVKNYNLPQEIASFIEEILDNRGNIYAAERHISEFITASINRFKKENG